MPARVTIPSIVQPSNNKTTLNFSSTLNGFAFGDTTIQGNGIRINSAKLYNITCQVTFEQNGSSVKNTCILNILKNGSLLSETPYSYNVNDLTSMSVSICDNLSVNDLITVEIKFDVASSVYIPSNKSVFLCVF